jgi:hypothetical protein
VTIYFSPEAEADLVAVVELPGAELVGMFDMLNMELPIQGCDHSRWITKSWLARRGHDVETVFAWLETQGGYCDCEVLANVEQEVDEARRASKDPPH